MTEEQRSQIAFQWCFACVVIWHCQHQQARIKVRGALYGLQRQGIVKRVGKDRWVYVKK